MLAKKHSPTVYGSVYAVESQTTTLQIANAFLSCECDLLAQSADQGSLDRETPGNRAGDNVRSLSLAKTVEGATRRVKVASPNPRLGEFTSII